MKRLISIFLLFTIAASLFGCGLLQSRQADEASFYYSRDDFAYGTEDSVIVAEVRDISGHIGDLKYLLALYLMGPQEEELTSVFPRSTKLVSATLADTVLTVELTPIEKTMTDSEFSLACAALSMTCLNLTDAAEVTVISGERTVTMGTEDLLLYDDPIPTESQSEETQ